MIPIRVSPPARVCVVKPSSLGDVVHAFPTVLALRDLWPDARISWVVNRGLRGLVDGHPAVDETIPFDRDRLAINPKGLRYFTAFLRDLSSRRFDLAVDLQGLLRSALMARAACRSRCLGMTEAREGATRFYTDAVPTSVHDGHSALRMYRVARALGATGEPRIAVASTQEDRIWVEARFAGLRRPILAVNMGARWVTKRWPPSHFAEVARRAVRELGASIVAVGAPEDAPIVAEFKDRLGPIPCLDLTGGTTLPRLAEVARASDCFLSNDTGPLHLAAAAGAGVVGVYTCTNPGRTGPFGPRAAAVRSCVWCAPSYTRRCDRLECMDELTPDRVWPAVERQLSAGRPGGMIDAA